MKSIFQFFFKGLYFFIFNAHFRKFTFLLVRYCNTKRYVYKKLPLFNSEILVADVKSYLWQYYEIFFTEYYKFNSVKKKPIIIDCGANIGLSVLDFKKQYPLSIIHAFEPDPEIYNILQSNITNYKLNNVNLYNQAIWKNNEELFFDSEGADGGKISEMQESNTKVTAIDFKKFLSKFDHIDFLKIDIEGAETTILPLIAEELYKIDNIFLEFHSYNDKPQYLSEVIQSLASNGHRLYIQNVHSKNQPFLNKKGKNNMDLQINIFAYKI